MHVVELLANSHEIIRPCWDRITCRVTLGRVGNTEPTPIEKNGAEIRSALRGHFHRCYYHNMKYGSKSQWTDCSALENVKKGGAWVSCFSQGVRRSDPFWQGAWVRAQLWNATAAIFLLENRWFPDFCSWKLTQIGHAQRPASQPASQPRERVQILQKIKQNY